MTTPATPPGGAPVGVRPCPVCHTQVAHDALFCPHCGTSFQPDRGGPDSALVAAGILAVIVGILIAVLVTRDNGDSTKAKTESTESSQSTSTATTSAPATPTVTTTTTAPPTATTPPATTATPAPSTPTPTATTPSTPAQPGAP